MQLVVDLRLQSEAVLRLHLGEYQEAITIYESLLINRRVPDEPQLAQYYLGLAACQHNLGYRDEARRNLENAGLSVLAGGRTLNRARAAGLLFGLYSFMGEADQVRDWQDFLATLECPEATKDLCLRRGRAVMARCGERESLVIM